MQEITDKNMYIGIDIGERHVLMSCFTEGMTEPRTVSGDGEESLHIPFVLAKEHGMSRWYYGLQAVEMMQKGRAEGTQSLLSAALEKADVTLEGEAYRAEELFTIFLRHLLSDPARMPEKARIRKIVVTIPEISLPAVELFSSVGTRLGLASGTLLLIDHRESFYYYALSQEAALYRRNVLLFDYEDDVLRHFILTRDSSSRPQMVRIAEGSHVLREERQDEDFAAAAGELLEEQRVSTVFLTGSGFEGEWMQLSLDRLCRGRRVFLGSNLYTKGACYAAMTKDGRQDWPFVYIGDHEMKMNISLKVTSKNEMGFLTLIEAGDSWYDAKGECEVILDGSPEFECWIQRPDSRKADIRVLELKEMPKREDRTTRLRIRALPLSDRKASIEIRDLGFGEIAPATNRVWEHIVELKEDEAAWES